MFCYIAYNDTITSVYLQVMGIIMQVMKVACWDEINTLS